MHVYGTVNYRTIYSCFNLLFFSACTAPTFISAINGKIYSVPISIIKRYIIGALTYCIFEALFYKCTLRWWKKNTQKNHTGTQTLTHSLIHLFNGRRGGGDYLSQKTCGSRHLGYTLD